MNTKSAALVHLCLFLTVFMVISTIGAAEGAGVCTDLSPVSPFPAARDMNGITVGEALVVSVGDHGMVLTAPELQDEFYWQRSSTPTTADLFDIAHTGQLFVAVGASGTILVSDDGLTWQNASIQAASDLRSVASDGHMVVAIGDNGLIVSSTNLQVWTPAESATTKDLEAIAWDGQAFVAVGETGMILTSVNGLDWTPLPAPTSRRLTGVACHAGVCTAVTENGSVLARHSVSHWTELGRPIWSANSLSSVRWAGDRFFAVGANGSQGASFDGVEWWVTGSGLESTSMQDVADASGRLIAVGLGGQIIASDDRGARWTLSNAMADVALRAGTRGNGKSVVVGGNFAWFGQGHILTSDDRRNWDLQFHVGYESVYDVAHGNGRYLGLRYVQELSGGWNFIESTNGESWRRVLASTQGRAPTFANDLEFEGDQFLLAGSRATLGTSSDGSNWLFSSLEGAGTGAFSGVASNGTVIVAVGRTSAPDAFGLLATSVDGITLVRRNVNPAPELSDVAWGAGRFVAVGADGWIMASAAGGWSSVPSPTNENLTSIRWLGAGFVAVGEHGTVLTSPDGLVWTTVESNTDSNIFDVFGTASDYFIVGDHGLLMRSKCIPNARIPSPPSR